MQDITVARLQSKRVQTSLPPSFNVMYYVSVSPWTVKIFLAQHCLLIHPAKERPLVIFSGTKTYRMRSGYKFMLNKIS
jgi:hypothetical protein